MQVRFFRFNFCKSWSPHGSVLHALLALLIQVIPLIPLIPLISCYTAVRAQSVTTPLQQRFETPRGASRSEIPAKSFGVWLRNVPLKPGKPPVHLYNGMLKGNQDAHAAVLDLSVGSRDLQQCADAVMRLRAEYLWAVGRSSDIAFNFTSGHAARYSAWRDGYRPVISGSTVTWKKSKSPDPSYANFGRYLENVFTYAGTASLEKELVKVPDVQSIQEGDVFIQGGFPGHAVIVMDMASNTTERFFLLAQSYMPAQEIHILRNLRDPSISPWFSSLHTSPLATPEWTFEARHLRRFKN